jgi:hypothetical protein
LWFFNKRSAKKKNISSPPSERGHDAFHASSTTPVEEKDLEERDNEKAKSRE